jgi:ABC-type nitrate/sulfonate/bicarbonate transport system ATPase subunit
LLAASECRDDVRILFQEARLLPWRTVLQNVPPGLAFADAPARA